MSDPTMSVEEFLCTNYDARSACIERYIPQTYHYPNRDHRTIGPFGSGATLKTDGEKIVGRVEAPAFKVGSVYRTRSGDVAKTRPGHRAEECFGIYLAGKHEGKELGAHSLEDGCFLYGGRRQHHSDLLPGELVQRDGQWVAMEEAKPAAHWKDAARARVAEKRAAEAANLNAQMLSRDARQPTARERGVMARINLAKSLAAEWEAAKKQPALPHPYPFYRNFQG